MENKGEEFGMKQAITNRSKKKIVDLIVQKRFEEVKEDIGFSSNIFMVFGLPTH